MGTAVQGDVHALEEKLLEFGSTLPGQERQVLDWLVARSRAVSTDADDQELEGAVGSQDLVKSLGFGEDAPTLVIGWSRAIF